MPETCSTAVDHPAPDDLISFLKAIPNGRYRRGVRYPKWFLLLVAVLGILSGCHSSRDLEAFARRHREVLNEALGLDFKRWPSDVTFLYLFNKAHASAHPAVRQRLEKTDQITCCSRRGGGLGGQGSRARERISKGRRQPLILHADNGNAMRAATLESRLEELGVLRSFSRPRVSNDNPYSESLFRTAKYRPDYPRRPFSSKKGACDWVAPCCCQCLEL